MTERCNAEVLLDRGGEWQSCELVADHEGEHAAYVPAVSSLRDVAGTWTELVVAVRWGSWSAVR